MDTKYNIAHGANGVGRGLTNTREMDQNNVEVAAHAEFPKSVEL